MLSNTDQILVDEACESIFAFLRVSDEFSRAMIDCRPLPWLLKIVDPDSDHDTAGTPAIAMRTLYALASKFESM